MEEQANGDTGKGSEQAGNPEAAKTFQQWLKDMEGRVVDGLKDLEQTLKTEYHNAVPPEVSGHLNKSKEEFLLAIRTVVDRNLERTRKGKNPETPSSGDSPNNQN